MKGDTQLNKSKFVLILLLAHCLISISFFASQYFWTFFPITMVLLSFVAWRGWSDTNNFTVKGIFIGLISGFILYSFFFLSYILIKEWFPYFMPFIIDLYNVVGPTQFWHFFMLTIIIIPGEEIFWRGYVQEKLSLFFSSKWSKITVASILYGVAHIWTGNPMLIAAAIAGGLFWGFLYYWKKNIYIVILSHYTFNLFLLILLPLTF